METINVTVLNGTKQLVILQGKALDPIQKDQLKINGQITSVANYISDRIKEVDCSNAIISVSENQLKLIVNQFDSLSPLIRGELKLHTDIIKLAINKEKTFTAADLAKLFRFNISWFETKQIGKEIISGLLNFKAKITKDIEKYSDQKGNKTDLMRQIIDSNQPTKFKLNICFFEGFTTREEIVVETYVNDDLSVQLVCDELDEILKDVSDKIFNFELDKIKLLKPDICIIYI